MIGLDTNVLVRYLVQDDHAQAALATEVIEHRLSEDEPGFVTVVAMIETVWVLDRHYRFGRDRIAGAVEGLLRADVLVIENAAQVFTAMIALREGRGEFSDALIDGLCARAGSSRVLTFDRGALRLPGFEHP